MDIVEKLGLKCYEPSDGLECGYSVSNFDEIEWQRDYTLGALISVALALELCDIIFEDTIVVIENITGKTWEQIKGLIK